MDWREVAEISITVVPLTLYFGFLGLVNIRRRPTVVSGRRDFLVVVAAFLPLLYRPMRMVLSLGDVFWQSAVIGVVGVILWLLLPREFTSWVVYSVSEADITRSIESILRRMPVRYSHVGNRFICEPPNGSLVISSMPLLRNVAVYLEGTKNTSFFARLGEHLQRDLSQVESQPSLSGHCFLAVAVTLLATPLVWMFVKHDGLYALLKRWLSAG